MPNRGPMPDTRSRLSGHWCQPGIGRQCIDGITRRTIQRRHEGPCRGHPADSLDTLQTFSCCGPRRLLVESRGHFALDLVNLGLEEPKQAVHPRAYRRNDLRVLIKRMELVTHLLA